jgi:exopolyphosphatase/guanosine-5'-triphosphate,3'-diphosphate pyrophosphatase
MSANISSTALKEVLSPFVSKSFSQLRHISYSLKAEAVIAMGSSVRALALLTGGAGAGHDGKVISVSREKFTECLEIAAGREPEKLSEDYGIDKEIAEAVVPCGMILDHLFELAGATRLIVPMTSTKDALLLDYINELTRKRDYFSAQILGVVKNIARKYNSLDKLTESVVEYSKFLFQKTADVHGLSEKDEMLLVMAAYLHKIGLFVNNRGYHKLSSYLILCTEIPGIKAEQRKTVALVARYHRKAFPKPAHVDYMAMAPGSKRKINKLAAILRLACGIAGVLGPFKTFVVKNTDEILYLNFKNRQGRVLNKTDILKSADLFSYVFSKNIEVD